jgi:hypothetical protein
MLVHHIPIKFAHIFRDRFDLTAQDPELRRGFMTMVKLSVDYVKAQDRDVVRSRSGQGGPEALEPFSIPDLDEIKSDAMRVLSEGGRPA